MRLHHPMLVADPHPLLNAYPVVVSIVVEWGDQDMFQHVNNTVYLKWCETARVVYLELAGMWQLIAREKKGPIVASLSCQYLKPVTFPDTIQVGARVTRTGQSSFRMEHGLVSLRQQELVAECDSVMVFYDYANARPIPLTQQLRDAFAGIEGHPVENTGG